MKRGSVFILLIIMFTITQLSFAGVTGKIAGTITDDENGEPLIGVNVIVTGTSMGAATDLDGNYVILNVPPGLYELKVSMIGYSQITVREIRVNIDQTTPINVKLKSIVIMGQEIQITAERPVVEQDVAASKTNVTSEQIQALPATTVGEVLGLQAGITSNLEIRGSGSDQALFMVDGIGLRDSRNNQPIAAVPLTAVQDLSVQTGGFDAEYTNVRGGIINTVTREGDKNYFSGSVSFKIRPPGPKHFGISPYDANSFWLRPYLDEAVCWTGTDNGVWDEYLRRQYPEFKDGWIGFSEAKLKDDDPNNDLSPTAARKLFTYEHRQQGDIEEPDYNIDGGFGGPVPVIGQYLGDLRFFASFKREQEMYLMQLSRDALINQSTMLKLTSNITPSMKLVIMGLYGEIFGTAQSRGGGTDMMSPVWDVASEIDRAGFTVPWRIYTDTYWSTTARYFNILSAKLTHQINPKTFYEAQIKSTRYKYFTTPGRNRDYSKRIELWDGYFVGEEPFGFQALADFAETPIGNTNLAFGGPISTARDYTRVASYSTKFNLISQVNHNNQVTGGVEFVFDDFNMSFGSVNTFLPEGNYWSNVERQPYRMTAYLSDKLEYKGFMGSLGLIAEYINPNGDWPDLSENPYGKDFASQNFREENRDKIEMIKAKSQFVLSPRLAISHPITINSKLYFNYGHYRQMPTAESMFRETRKGTNQLDVIGNPGIPMARTVSYELGYDHAIFNNLLLHLSAYYKDVTDQQDYTEYISLDGSVKYSQMTANSYEDIRGFEVDLSRSQGKWLIGRVNYEYRVETSGFFGYKEYNENPSDQREYERKNPKQTKPRPRPRFKTNLDFHTPSDYSTSFLGERYLGDWHVNLLAYWTAGYWFTWNPLFIPGIEYNFQRKSTYDLDLKISKRFTVGDFEVTLFADIFNVFNFKHFSWSSFYDSHDYDFYMKSLHLPAEKADRLNYGNIPGDDKPGDVRKEGVEFTPIEWRATVATVTTPSTRAIYYDASAKKYLQYANDQWVEVSKGRIDQVLEDKAYIDMPNQTFFTFLNPRNTFWGLTVSYRF